MDNTEKLKIIKVTEAARAETEDVVTREFPLTILFNDNELVTLLCTPADLGYLAVGFLASEGFIISKDEIKRLLVDDKRGIARVESTEASPLADDLIFKRFISSGCGRGASFYSAADVKDQAPVESQVKISAGGVFALMKRFQQASELFRATGGVHFMAETASILSPEKKVLLPDMNAGCPMADMITAAGLREMKEQYPGASVVCYVNTTAEVKAESDICCTSANAVRVVESLNGGDIIFVPDQYLGDYVRGQTGRSMHLWPGYCPTHVKIRPEDIQRCRREYPQAKVVVHPECRPEVIALADETLSTGGMIRYARRPEVTELVLGTEPGIIHRLEKENPGKKFFAASEKATCPNMKLITLEKVYWALEALEPEVKVAEDIRLRAKAAVDRMLEVP